MKLAGLAALLCLCGPAQGLTPVAAAPVSAPADAAGENAVPVVANPPVATAPDATRSAAGAAAPVTASPTTQAGEGSAKPVPPAPILAGEIIALILVLLASGWLLFLGGRMLSPARIAAVPHLLTFRKHWGGFGGESSGWQISAPLGASLAGLLLIVLGAGLAAGSLAVLHYHEPPPGAAAPKGKLNIAATTQAATPATATAAADAEQPAGGLSADARAAAFGDSPGGAR